MCESDLSNQMVSDEINNFFHKVYNVSQPANYWQQINLQIQNIREKWEYTFFFVQVIFYTFLTIFYVSFGEVTGEQFFFFAGLLMTIADFIRLFV
eukprot:UN02677